MADNLDALLAQVRACQVCAAHLPLGCRPVVQAGRGAKLLIVGQAPGRKVHDTGIPWNDPSGDRLRSWLHLDRETFYDPEQVAIIPMGLCYPGKGKSGDLPPRKECAPLWHERLFHALPNVRLTLLIGSYAQNYYLSKKSLSKMSLSKKSGQMTQRVAHFADFLPRYFPLPHPSGRNVAWFKHHPWFEQEVLPELAVQVALAMAKDA